MLTEQQIKNWRIVLSGLIGPYALIMPKEEIEVIKNKIENHAATDEKMDVNNK